MAALNKVMLIGNLGRDPEIRATQAGEKIASLSIATSEQWTDKNSGEKRERTEWHRVVIFNERLAEVAEKYLKKGSRTYVEGQLQTRKWTDQQGVERYTTEVVLTRFRGDLVLLGDARGGPPPASSPEDYGSRPAGGAPAGGGGGGGPGSDLDDDIPF